ncbi:MAG: hypothetical protein J6S67_06700 [Methanobrevibacter sp.]|nr:hypothetical protein [Methanobrevibacter sp.]
MDDSDQAWSDYYDDFIKRKNEIMSKLKTIQKDKNTHKVYREWLEQSIEFINEQKG